MIKKFLILLIFIPFKLNAQVDSLSNYFDEIQIYLETASVFQEEEETNIYEIIEEILRNPIQINEANVNELLAIPFLDFASADIIVKYRDANKKFFSLNELYMIDNLSINLANLLKPLLTLEKTSSLVLEETPFLNFIKSRNRILQDIQTRKGFDENNYLGNKFKIYNRLQANADKYFINLTVEKDAGEKSFSDFYSASFSISDFSIFNKIVLGDYNFAFGQGLAIFKPFGAKKSSYSTLSVIKNQKNISEYTSTDENKFFRGIALSATVSNLSANFFFSQNTLSTNFDDFGNITSLKLDGIYRTDLDLQKKSSTNLQSFGSSISYNQENFNIGLLYSNFNFSRNFSEDYSEFIKNENQFNFIALDYSANFKNIFTSGEFSYNGLSVASINNLFINISRRFRFITSFRNYPSNYFNFFSNGFGERSNTQNEVGFYSGFQLFTDYGTFDIYFDQFKFPNKNQNKFSFTGNELSIFYQKKIIKNFDINFRFLVEKKDDEIVVDENLLIGRTTKQRFRTDFLYSIQKNISLKTRFEINLFEEVESKLSEFGYLAYQDIKININSNFKFFGRFIVFKTDSYNTRIYEFENDFLGVMSNRALYGDGFRWYLLIKYKLINQLVISAKYSTTLRSDVESLGSGNQEILGNVESQISLQIELQF